ncbi:hypothetical protein KY285_030360 [Solanum tuberosum]|nr:hypothetical protein KY285_030360 [Solanum tuberosum]
MVSELSFLGMALTRNKNPEGSTKDMDNNFLQIQEQLQKLMESMNDRNVRTNKKLLEIKQAIGGMKQRDKELDNCRGESSAGGYNSGELTQLNTNRDIQTGLTNQFFSMDEIPYSQRVKVTSIHLDREAIAWHRSYMNVRNTAVHPTWTEYILDLNERFGDGYEDSMEAIKHLEQTSNVRAYQDEFDRLLIGVNLSNENAISCFLGGLKPELNKSVKMQAPKTLMQAYKLARLQKEGNVNGRKLLTATEMDEKRAKGLCFLCDEKYDQEAIDNIANPEECMTISLQAFTGVTGKLGCKASTIMEQSISVADGRKVQTASICRNLQWLLLGASCSSDFLLLPLGNIDIVLGVQWLNTLGRILFDFSKRTIEFMHQGKKHVLRGATTQVKITKAKVLNKKPAEQVQFYMLSLNTSATFQCNHIQAITARSNDIPAVLVSLMEQYKCIFDIPTALPPHKGPYDHKIPLIDKAIDINLNHLTMEDKFLIPIIEDLLDELGGAEVFSKIDLRAGYHQLRMAESDVHKTAFKTHEGHYEFLVIPFGTMSAHVDHLRIVFELMKHHQLYAKAFKCAFGVTEVEYLRHFISAKGVAIDPKKVSAIQAWELPTTIKQLRGFLVLAGYYRRFIKGFGAICIPLHDLLKKDSFVWTEEATAAFLTLKEALVTAHVLALPNYAKPFVIQIDANGTCIGVVLMQQGHPIAYISKTLAPRYQSMCVYDRELLELVAGISKLMAFDFTIEYKKGLDNKVADALSKNQGSDHQLREHIIQLWHSTPHGGHSGMDATIRRLQSLFYWKTMVTNMRSFINRCDVCQRHKYDASAYPGLIQPLPIPEGVWTDISLDFIKGFPKSKGKDVILVVVDMLSCMVCPLLWLVTVTDLVFLSSFWQELFTLQGVQLHKSTTYHPQTDGQTENTTYHLAIKCSPYEGLYGQNPHIHLPYLVDESSNEMVDRFDRQFSVGDWVLLKLQPYRQFSVATRPYKKLAAKYFGPYLIDAKIGEVAYRLLLPADVLIHPTFHVSQLKKCHAVPVVLNHPPVLHMSSPYCPLPEDILERRMIKTGNKAVCQVLVKLLGIDLAQATWEILTELQHRFPSFQP